MYKVSLICMPFADPFVPSLALTQLKCVVDSLHHWRVSTEILYLNHDFTHYFGPDFYIHAISFKGILSGIGDWIFRRSAFPGIPDNTEDYFMTYYSQQDKQTQMLRQFTREKSQELDNFLSELIAMYRIDESEMVGFTSGSNQNMACFALAGRLKDLNSDIITVMGGPNCVAPMGQEIVKHMDQIDFVFSGPSLKNFPEFVQHCLDQDMEKCSTLNGVFSKTNCGARPSQTDTGESALSRGTIGTGTTTGEEVDINVRIELDYGSFLDAVERNFPDMGFPPILVFETSRGCWWADKSRCTFCSCTDRERYRAMGPEKAIEQFKSLFKFYPRCKHLRAVDAILPKEYPKEVFPFIDAPPGVNIIYETRATFDDEDFKTLSRAGMKEVQVGIEALSTPLLKLMKKGTTSLQNLVFLKNCRMYDIYPYWNLLLGFPGEDEDIYEKYVDDIPLLTHLPPPTGAYPVQFHRGNHYFNNPEEYGLDLRPYDFYRLTYPFDEKILANFAFYFSDSNFDTDDMTIAMNKWIGRIRDRVIQWQTQWYGESQSLSSHPDLFLETKWGSTIVYDSRSGEAHEFEISDAARKVLDHLKKPARIADLGASLRHIQGLNPVREIASLKERGLLFQENEHLLSLVLPQKPPKMTCSPRDYGLKGVSQQ